MYIDGQFTESEGKEWMDVTNPATDEVISQVPKATRNDVIRAIDAAEQAQAAWEETPAVERGKYLHAIADGIRAEADSIARLISEEVGKTLELSTVEVHFTADYLDYMAEWARRYEGRSCRATVIMSIFLYSKERLASPRAFCPGTSRSS